MKNRASKLIIMLLLGNTGMHAGVWDTMRKNTVAVYKKQPVLITTLAATVLASGLGFLIWKLAQRSQVVAPRLPIRFNKQISLDTLADLPGLLQEELGEDHDWSRTVVIFRAYPKIK